MHSQGHSHLRDPLNDVKRNIAGTGQNTLSTALVLINQKEFVAAERILWELKRVHPENQGVLSALGLSLMSQGKYRDALGIYEHLIELNSSSHEFYNLLALNLIRLNRFNSALEMAIHAAKLAPSNITYQVNLGQLYVLTGDWQQAITILAPCLSKVPSDLRQNLEGVLKQCTDRQRDVSPSSPSSDTEKKQQNEPAPLQGALPEQNGSMPWLNRPWVEVPSYQEASISEEALAVLKGRKILIGPSEIAGMAGRLSRLMKQIGVKVDSLDYGYNRWANYKCDISLNLAALPAPEILKRIKGFAERAISEYDVFHFIYGRSLLPDLSDLSLLSNLGKKIVMSFIGSDSVAQEVILYNQARFLGYDPPKPFYMTRQHADNHWIVNRYADVILGNNSIPRGRLVPGFAETDAWTLQKKQEVIASSPKGMSPNKLYVLFAPTSDFHKGTNMVLNLLNQCKAKGLPIELLLVRQLPLEQARKVYALADVVIDNVGSGTFGLLGVELMLWEVPVLVYQTEFYRHLRKDSPDLHITHANFIDTIARCLEMKQNGELAELGHYSRQWVLDHLDVRKQGIPEYLNIYSTLLQEKPVAQFTNQTWYQLMDLMKRGVKSRFYEFMFKNRVFDQIGVKVTDYDKALYF